MQDSIQDRILTALEISSGSPQYIAEATGISRSAVQKHLKQLLDEGYLEKSGARRQCTTK